MVAGSQATVAEHGRACRFEVEVSGPFRLDLTVWALRRRAHNAVDTWDGTWYRRTVVLGNRPFEMSVRQVAAVRRPRLAVELRGAGKTPGPAVTADAQRLLERTLGLGADLAGFYALAERDPRLAELVAKFVGVRPPWCITSPSAKSGRIPSAVTAVQEVDPAKHSSG